VPGGDGDIQGLGEQVRDDQAGDRGPRRTVPEPVSDDQADVLLLLVALVWGSSYLVAQRTAVALGVLPVLALRFGIAALETSGVTRTSATNAGLLISLTVVLTPLMEGAAARRRLPRTFFVAVVVAVVGVALLVSADGLRAPTSGGALMLAAAFVRAVHVTASGGLTRGRPVRTLTLTLVQTWVCALGFALAAPGELAAAVGRAGAGQWWQLAYLGWHAPSSPSSCSCGRYVRRPRPGPACCWAPSRCGPY
jgi:drug/metabolite transporter (DMT)-like permease